MIPDKKRNKQGETYYPLDFPLGDTFQTVEQGEQLKVVQHSVAELGRQASEFKEAQAAGSFRVQI